MGGTAAPDLTHANLKGVRLMALETLALDDIEDAPKAGYEAALERLRAAGAVVERGTVPEVAFAQDLAPVLFASEAYGTWKDAIEAAPDKMFANVRERFRGGKAVSGPDYVAGWLELERLRMAYARATAGYDAVLVPTCPILPPNVARLETDTEYFVRANLMTLRNTRIGNLMGLAAVTLPTGLAATGISLMVRPGREGALLRMAAAAEAALR
jgi:aspartyl-tRNA(Asn)/glutamyl-tRNA(Gln) amidotransferase subunit A